MTTGTNPFANEISRYSNNKILKIIQNSNDYASQLVFGCRIEAGNRNLEINNVSRANNSYINEVKDYSDAKLISMIHGGIEDPSQLLSACLREAESRNLSIEKVRMFGSFRPDEIMEVQERLKINESIDEIKNNLVGRGLSEEDALNLIEKAVNSKELRVISEAESEEPIIGFLTAISIFLMVFRWIYSLSN